MQITISARHGHLSDQTQQKISEKAKKLRKFFDRITAIEVTVDLEHQAVAMQRQSRPALCVVPGAAVQMIPANRVAYPRQVHA